MDTRVFDIDAMTQAIEPMKVKMGGELYEVRLLGYLESVATLQRLGDIQKRRKEGERVEQEFLQFVKDLCAKLGIPHEILLQQPAPVVLETLQSFLKFLAQMKPESLTSTSD